MTPISDEYMRRIIATRKKLYRDALGGAQSEYAWGGKDYLGACAKKFFSPCRGKLSIVCPVNDGSDLCGIGIFHTAIDEARSIMEKDPGILQKVFTYELHLCRSFPGDEIARITSVVAGHDGGLKALT